MESKSQPNPEHGCLHKALLHEPMFILLGRDPAAPTAIRRWGKYRRKFRPDEEDQIAQAEADADLFEQWRKDHDGEWRDPDAPRGIILIPSDEVSSLAGRILAMKKTDEVPVQGEAFDQLLADAKSLAGFVLNADPIAGSQDG
jgi:cell envelope opacity-associated protein A